MAKRIVTKIGDVFCVEVDGRYKQFFQYIANDLTCLNSSTIRVFQKEYPMEYKPVVDDIVKDEVMFYAHTVLRFGIQEGVWYKVGKSADLGLDGLNKILFGTPLPSKYGNEDGKRRVYLCLRLRRTMLNLLPRLSWSVWEAQVIML